MDLNSLDDDGANLNIVLYGRSSSRCFELFSSFMNTVCQDVEATERKVDLLTIRTIPLTWIYVQYSDFNLEIRRQDLLYHDNKNLCESSSRKCLDFCPLGRKRDGDVDCDHPLNTSPHYHRPGADFHHDS